MTTARIGSKSEEIYMENKEKALVLHKQPKTLSEFCEQDEWLLQRISTVEQITRGPVLDAIAKAKMTELWRGTLNEIGPARFDEALKHVIQASSFHPTIAEIRKAAGINRGIQDPVEQKAMSELRLILAIMRVHGVQMKPLVGRILNDGKDEQGRVLQVPLRTPETRPPTLEPRTEAAIVELGFGSRVAGLEMIAGHPAINKECDPQFRLKNAAEIEKRWIQAYAGVR